ncbi:kinase-like domain-containing protein [Phellopilus nigrolimitatus]|nr:kinase-like domain-containing protein [Phellopilus nigrolimitatus]
MPSPASTTWPNRKAQLRSLLDCTSNDDEQEGVTLDRLLHGQAIIGRTQKTTQIERLRFSDNDLESFGPLADAQFGIVELVSCRLDGRVYVRKRVAKAFALKNREQTSPQTERHLLLLALKSKSNVTWAPRMLCAYQCATHLNIVMEYAAGGSLWDVLECAPRGRLAPADLAWWAPQCVAALGWCHEQDFAHRDVKPHNFVLRPSGHLLLIDFGSAAPLLPPANDGTQLLARENCVVPCGTCDYISPEILRAHEEALVALEMSDNEDDIDDDSDAGLQRGMRGKGKKNIVEYGRETDWWSLGAMLYEMAYGVAPFFANDIRQTYARIMEHEISLKFDRKAPVPPVLVSLLKGLLTHHETRLGRHSVNEIKSHIYFKDVDWSTLHSRPAPRDLLLPQFTYTTPLVPPPVSRDNEGSETSPDASKPFAFSALFQSSVASRPTTSPGLSHLQTTLSTPSFGRRNLSRSSGASAQKTLASFIGFSWGPPKDAFNDVTRVVPAEPVSASPGLLAPSIVADTSAHPAHPLITPMRPTHGTGTPGIGSVPPSTIRRVMSVRSNTQARPMSEREAMRLLVDCVGMSARKRVLESGKKPKVLLPHFGLGFPPPPPTIMAAGAAGEMRNGTGGGAGRPRAASHSRSLSRSSAINTVRKELRFDDTTTQIRDLSYSNTFSTNTGSGVGGGVQYASYPGSDATMSSDTEGTGGPPSPSPSPRPGSAMSMLSISRRSATPTVSSMCVMGSNVGMGMPRASSETPETKATRPRSESASETEAEAENENKYRSMDITAAGSTFERNPTTTSKNHSTPYRTRSADPSTPAVVHRRDLPLRSALKNAPPPISTAHARARTSPKTHAYTNSNAQPRTGVRRKTVDIIANPEEDVEFDTEERSHSWSGSENESESGSANDDLNGNELQYRMQTRSRSPSFSPGARGGYESGTGMYEDMERRYERLMADIAGVKAQVEGLVAQVR